MIKESVMQEMFRMPQRRAPSHASNVVTNATHHAARGSRSDARGWRPKPALPPKPTEEKLAALFIAVDTDNNGAVSRAELKAKLAAELEAVVKQQNAKYNEMLQQQLNEQDELRRRLAAAPGASRPASPAPPSAS